MSHPTETFWEVNDEGEIVCNFHNDKAWRTVTVSKHDLPAAAWRVAMLMNNAFKSGMEAKQLELRRALGEKA